MQIHWLIIYFLFLTYESWINVCNLYNDIEIHFYFIQVTQSEYFFPFKKTLILLEIPNKLPVSFPNIKQMYEAIYY